MYIVRLDEKNVYEVDLNDKRIPENTSTPTVTPFKETMTIAGYACQKYQIQYDNDMKLYVWTTPAINADHWSEAPVFGGQLKLPDGVAGFPLRLELVSSKFTVTATAIAVKATEMNAIGVWITCWNDDEKTLIILPCIVTRIALRHYAKKEQKV